MTIHEIADLFPNGLHDAEVETIHIDHATRTVTMTVYVWIGIAEDPADERDTFRLGTLEFRDVSYCAMDVPGDIGATFTCRPWVNERNGFVHLAAQEASFTWSGEAAAGAGEA